MLSMKKTAALALIGTLTLGAAYGPAEAGERRHGAREGDRYSKTYKASYGHRHDGKRARSHQRRYREHRRKHWREHRRARRDYRREHRRKRHHSYRHWREDRWSGKRWRKYRRHHRHHRHWHRGRWHYHGHKHHRHHRHGKNDFLFGTLIGAAIGAIITDSAHSAPSAPPAPVKAALPPPDHSDTIGFRLGRSMSASDQEQAAIALETARTGRAVEWRNSENGNNYTLTATRTFRNGAGQDCRDYTLWGWVDGFEEKLDATACRSAAGAWRTVS